MFGEFSLGHFNGFTSSLAKIEDLSLLSLHSSLFALSKSVAAGNEEELRDAMFQYINPCGLLHGVVLVLYSVSQQLAWTVVNESACTGTCLCKS